jgi:hypothetical protein
VSFISTSMSADDNTRAPWASPGGDQTGDKHGCVQMPDGVFVNGWRIATRRTPILGREELRRCAGDALFLPHDRAPSEAAGL